MMNRATFSVVAVCGLAAFIAPTITLGQDGPPPAMPVGEFAATLGVSEDAMTACMPKMDQSARPQRPDASVIASCLQASNAAVTPALVNETLAAFAPAQPPRRN